MDILKNFAASYKVPERKWLEVGLVCHDFLQMMQKADVVLHRELLLDTLEDLRWSINKKKSQLRPATSCTFIGFDVHSKGEQGPWLKVLPAKIRKLKNYIRRALASEYIAVRQLAKIAGQCIAMTTVVLPAKLLLRNIYRCIRTKNLWHSHVRIDKHVKNDLYWWLTVLENWNDVPLCIQQSEIQLECNTSASGWGATIPSLNTEASGTWNKEVSFKHSNYRELLTILIAKQSFKKELRG